MLTVAEAFAKVDARVSSIPECLVGLRLASIDESFGG